MPRRRARGNVDFSRLITLRGNLSVGYGNTDMWNEISTMTPLGYRASFLAYFKFPASFASYMYGVSPALMSQNNYKEDIEREMSRQSGYQGFRPIQMLGAWRALAKMYYDNTANPNRDVPSRIRRQEGVTPTTIADFKVFVDQLASTASDGVTQDAASDAPLAQTMPVEGVSVSIDGDGNNVSADEEVIAEMSAGMDGDEEVVEEVTDTTTSPNVRQAGLIESLYTLYQGYWRRSHNIQSEEDLKEKMLLPVSSLTTAAKTILTLEGLGYGYTGIKNFLYTMSLQGLMLDEIRNPSTRTHNAYISVNLRGTSVARRYRSGKAYGIMMTVSGATRRLLEEQFQPSTGRPLQIMAFRGTGVAMVGYQVLSLDIIQGEKTEMSRNEGVRKLNTTRANAHVKLRNALEGLGQPTPAQASTDTQPTTGTPTADSSLKFYLIGYQQFTPQQTFRERAKLSTEGGLQSIVQRKSYVFYFATLADGRITGWYRSIFGVAGFAIPTFQVASGLSLTKLKDQWNDSGNLDERGVLKISPVPESDVNNLRQALQQILANAPDTQQFGEGAYQVNSFAFKPTRSVSDRFGNVPFTDIYRRTDVTYRAIRSNVGQNEIVLGANTQASGGQSGSATSSSSSTTLTEFDMKAVSKQPFKDLTFGWELEGYIKKRRRSINALLNSNNPAGALKFDYGETMPVNGGSYKMVSDASINHPDRGRGEINRKDDGYEDYDVAELVSPVLEGEKGLILVDKSVQALNSSGFRINSSAGLHVHFDAMGRGSSPKFKAWQLANMMINYHVLHPVIDKYQNVGRTGGTVSWAKDFNESQLSELRAFSDSKSNDYLKLYKEIYKGDRYVNEWKVGESREHYHGSRYRTVNIHSAVSRAGTVEFRQGSPSTDYDYIKNWILWLYYIVKASEVGYIKKPSGDMGFQEYLKQAWKYTEWLLPDDVASFIANSTYMIDGANIESATRARARANRR